MKTAEERNRVKRSDLYNRLYNLISQIPRKSVKGDAMDAANCAYEIEKLIDSLLKQRAVEFLNHMSCIEDMDKETGESLAKENERLYDTYINKP